MGRIKNVLLNFRVILLMIFILLAVFAIYPNPWNQGVAIKAIARNSSAEIAGFESPRQGLSPMGHERILAINNKPIADLEDYYEATSSFDINETVQVKTSKKLYTLLTKPKYNITVLNETEIILINQTIEVNETINGTEVLVNKTVTKEIEQPKRLVVPAGTENLGFSVSQAATSNLRKGLDIQGGTRVLLKPAEVVDDDTMRLVIDSLKYRLNVYGLGDVVVTEVSDSPDFIGGGQKFVLVEIAGVTEDEVRDLLSRQGKFEARIGDNLVFKGGKDITYVCRTAECSGIDPNRGCGMLPNGEGWSCAFSFAITITPEAAELQAALTKDLSVIGDSLSEELVLFLDDSEVDRLHINVDLKGRAVTDIAITGGGRGLTEASAIEDALKGMKRLQTVLITGSLPVKLDLVRIDQISPSMGKEFLKNALFIGVLAIFSVAVTLVIAYRRLILAIPILLTCLSEIFLTVGMAALIGWNIDLAAIAGLILAVGTGVNDQIVITDEALRGSSDRVHNWKDRIKRAFFIIFSAYMTTVVAMVPLLFAGAGLLKGFAITSILAVSIGVFITRPAFAAIIRLLAE